MSRERDPLAPQTSKKAEVRYLYKRRFRIDEKIDLKRLFYERHNPIYWRRTDAEIHGMRNARDRTVTEPFTSLPDAADPLAAMYDSYSGPIFRQALAILGSHADAEDVLQEVFMKLARRPDARIKDPMAYLLTAAHHEAYSILRRRRRERGDGDAAAIADIPAPGRSPDGKHEAIREALESLPAEQREVVTLKVYEQMTFEEIGRAVGASANTVASRYRYALQKLRRALGDPSHA